MLRNTVNKETYLSKDFKPEQIANALIRETTAPQDSTVDINPALKRIQYDLEEIEREIKALSRENTDTFLDHADVTDSLLSELGKLKPAKQNMAETYAKLEHDFMEPYNRATQLDHAGNKLFATAQLSRYLSWYLQLALQAQSQEFTKESVISSGGAGSALLRTSHAISALSKLVKDIPDLSRINVVEQFESKIPLIKKSLIESATKIITEFDGSDKSQPRMAASALIDLGADVHKIIESHTQALSGTSVLQIIRNSGSVIEFERAFEDSQRRAAIVSSLMEAYTECSPVIDNSTNNSTTVSTQPKPLAYWSLIATQLDQKLKNMSVANPAGLKAIIINKGAILSSTESIKEVHNVFAKYLGTP